MKYLIKGITVTGSVFRPSDWSERLCSVFTSLQPKLKLASCNGDRILGYSPYVRPALIDEVRCVVLDSELSDIEPLALEFVLNFAKDNNLQIVENYQQQQLPIESVDQPLKEKVA
jgi:hypothetical protein